MMPHEQAATAVDYDPFAGDPLACVLPTTPAQREIWLACQLEPEASLAYNEAISLTFKGLLDVPALEAALHDLVERHEALRATFGDDGASMFVAEQAMLPLERHDSASLPPFESDARIQMLFSQRVSTPFDLGNGPLFRADIVGLGADCHLLVLCAHHLVCDGWSFGVIVRDLAALYARHAGQAPGLDDRPKAPDAFSAFARAEAAYMSAPAAEDDARYWLERFATPPPVLDLPVDHPRPRYRTFASRREDRLMDRADVDAIRRLGAMHRASFHATLVAGFAVLLRRLAGQDDVVIGIPSAGQAADGLDTLVGHAVNVLPLRARIGAEAPFAEVLGGVRDDLMDAFDHQRHTLGSLLARLSLARDPARLPLVAVLFNLDAPLDESTARFPGLRYDLAAVPREYENFELFVNAVPVDGHLRLECQYNADLFDGATIQGWLDAYVTLLRHAALAPDTTAVALPVVSDAVYRELAGLQPAPTPFPELRLAHEFFEQQCDRTPERIAVRHADRTLTYAALESRSNRIANALRARGIGHGALVGLSLGRGFDMLASVLGVLKSGAGYVPLDPAFPAERLAFMADDAQLATLVVDDAAPPAFAIDASHVLALSDNEVVHASFERPERDRRAATPDSVAYVIFTSGSTGRPKGVRVPHRAAANFLTSMQRVPGIAPDDRLVAVTTLSFDIAFMELMLPLTSGAEVVIAGRDDVRDGGQLRRLIEEADATMMQATPAGWRLLVDAGWRGRPAFRAVSGGEPLPLDLAEALLERCGEVWNGYGPTETTVYSTYWRVNTPRDGIYIGRPIANTTVHILDEHGNHCPLGVPGEIHIGGVGVTLGYLRRPDLTAAAFVTDPWSEAPDSRMYRTGDRGRWTSAGLIEHLGRLDFQVKVRGYRIEPGEIESALTDLPEVARAVVMAREDRPGDVRLVAYVVGHDGGVPDEESLRSRLRARLPDYMLPQHVLALPAIPLLPNGKIDRAALPPPIARSCAAPGTRVGPRNDDERRVAAAMEAVLALPDLDVRDDFFALGGHSLLAAQLTATLNREFGVSLSFRTLFDAPSVERLAATLRARIDAGTAPVAEPIAHRDDQAHAPLSLMQHRLWSLERLHPGRVTYNAPSAHRLRGPLDEDAFAMAFQALVQRQPSMRTAFRTLGDDVAQVVMPRLDYPLFPAEDLRDVPHGARDTVLMARLQALTDTPFDLGTAPLFSARLFRLAENEHVLFFMPHHIVWDGWSFDIFANELSALYRCFAEEAPSSLAALPVTYGDFATWHARWLQSPAFESQLAAWRERLARRGDVRALPTDQPRRPGMSGVGRTEWIRVSREQTDAMYDVARQADATLNMALLALYFVMLAGSTGRNELVVGTPVRGRNHSELEAVMGYFNNLLPLHVTVDPALPFLAFVREVRRAAIDAFGHPDVPLEYLQRELTAVHGSGVVLYQALFSFQDGRQRAADWGGLAHEQILLFQSGATEDLGLWFLESQAGLVGGVTYNADLLEADTACRMRERYLAMLRRVIDDPGLTLGELTTATPAERECMRRWQARTTTIEPPRDLHGMIQATATAMPHDVAIEHGTRRIGHAALQERAGRMVTRLRERGASEGGVVGLCVERGIDRIAALLAIGMTGATALLLDRADPTAFLRDGLADARATVMVGDAGLQALLDWPKACAVWLDNDTPWLAAIDASTAHGGALPDTAAVAFQAHDAEGKAFGAALSHRTLGHLVQSLGDALGVHAGMRLGGDALPGDPLSVLGPLVALASGATWVEMGTREAATGRLDAMDLCIATPETWQALLAGGWQGDAGLRAVIVGGSATAELTTRVAKATAGVWMLFGDPAVAPVITCGALDAAADTLHQGLTLAHGEAWILDVQGEPASIGAAGDLAVGGRLLAMPFGQRARAARRHGEAGLVRTGYRGRWLSGGRLQVLDRDDRRLRCHGMDVQPGALEAIALREPGVVRAIAVPRHEQGGIARVELHVVAAPGRRPDAAAVRTALVASLPAWAMPDHVHVLDTLPTLATGEPDLAALAVHDDAAMAAPDDTTTPHTETERLLAGIWQELLGTRRIRTSDNFFDVGGHSLLAVDMAQRVHTLSGVQLNLLDVANGTLGTLAAEMAVTPRVATTHRRGLFSRLMGRP